MDHAGIARLNLGVLVLIASGAIGFHLGYARFFDWLIPVESAQVLAGIVRYPEETPFYVHHLKLWTILHQVCAVFLRAGVSEVALSTLVSGVLGMLSLQALALFTFALSGRAVESSAAAVLFFVSGVTYAGAVYPIFLMGVPFTYGVVGLSLMVLIAALIGSGLHRTGAFLLGLAPAVHTGLALWLWIAVGACLLIDRSRFAVRPLVRMFLAGCAASAISYAIYAVMSSGVPSHPVAMDRRYLDAFVTFWDGHRRPLAFGELAVLLNAAALTVATVWLRGYREELDVSATFLLRFVQVNAALSIALVPLTWIPERLPVWLVVLMPGRAVNTVAMTMPALVFGLLGSLRSGWPRIAVLMMAVWLLVGDDSMLWRMFPSRRPDWFPAIPTHGATFAGAVVLLAAAAFARRRLSNSDRREDAPRLYLVPRIATIAVLMTAVAIAYRVPEVRSQIYIDHTNNLVLATAAAGDGLLLTAGDAHLMQLRVRRPMLIDTGALDTIPYTPGSGERLYRILLDIYGVDLFHPPPEQRWAGRLLESVHRPVWESYMAEDWRRIRRTYHVTQVLTSATFQLQLPVVAGDRRYLLYAIPD